MYINKQRL